MSAATFTTLFWFLSMVNFNPMAQVPTGTFSCGETKVGSFGSWYFSLETNWFFGGKLIVKGTDLPVSYFYTFDSAGNMVMVMYSGSGATQFNIAYDPFIWGTWEATPRITPLTGPYTLIFENHMDQTISISNETHLLYTFNKRLPATIIYAFSFGNVWTTTSIEYICNCRAPNADAAGIANCLGLT